MNVLQHRIVKGNGPPLIFIHGFGLDHRMWEKQIIFFSSHYKVIAPDLRGFGLTPPPSDEPFAYHEDMEELLDLLNVFEPAILVGHSMGARAVANFALCRPKKTKAVIFTNAAIEGYSFKEFDLANIYQAGKSQGVQAANQMWLDHSIFDCARENHVVADKLKEMVTEYSGWHYTQKAPFKPVFPAAYQQLENIKLPTLIITGEYDPPDFKTIAEHLHEKIAGSVKKEIAGAGHMCNMEAPGIFNEIVNEFLNSVNSFFDNQVTS
jgi:pimeloyl-ACP methyl ester carboxylesterase